MKNVIGRRYYPTYYGKISTKYSYRSYYVGGEVLKGSADFLAGTCDDSVCNGWVSGPHGGYATKTRKVLQNLNGFKAI